MLPVVAVIVGAVLVGLAARRWRRDQRRDEAEAPAPAGPDPSSDDGQATARGPRALRVLSPAQRGRTISPRGRENVGAT